MTEDLNSFYLNQEEPNQSCLLALRQIILNSKESITEYIKYGLPCFMYLKKHICYLWRDKKTLVPYILFVDGSKLNHPLLESGDRKRMKILSINPTEDIDIEMIQSLLNDALKLHQK